MEDFKSKIVPADSKRTSHKLSANVSRTQGSGIKRAIREENLDETGYLPH